MTPSLEIDELFRLYYRPLCLYALHFVRDHDCVEDIVQEAFSRLWARVQDAQAPDSPKAYLYASVRNGCIDELRRRGAGPMIADAVEEAESVPDEEIQEKSFSEAALWTAIDHLPGRRREMLLMEKRDGLTCKEIASKMGVSEGTVRNQISRALKTLREGARKIILHFFA